MSKHREYNDLAKSIDKTHPQMMRRRQKKETIDEDKYKKYMNHFDPDLYNPDLWTTAASRAGMKYAVMTTKHHDGFCLWDSQLTDFKSTNSKCKKDLINPYVKACRSAGLRLGLYYSLYDWHHDQYVIDYNHPLRYHPDAIEYNKKRNMDSYCSYFHGQVEELMNTYRDVDILWFDMSFKASVKEIAEGFAGKGKDDWKSEELIRLIRGINPRVIINNRLDMVQDIVTPEQFMPRSSMTLNGDPVIWETCQTLNGAWGYEPESRDWKDPFQLIQMLVNAVSRNGNLLLNISPTGRGDIDEKTLDCLDVYSIWMKKHSRSIYGCGESGYIEPVDCRYTQNKDVLYLHIFNWPFKHIHLDGLENKIEYAQLLHDGSEVDFRDAKSFTGTGNSQLIPKDDSVVLTLPVLKPNVTVPVIEIFLKS